MYRINGFKTSLLLVLFTLAGCEKDVTFNPKEGEEKRYWVYTHTTQDIEQNNDTAMISQSLVHYRVAEVGETLKLHVTPEHMQFSAGYSGFSSVDASRKNKSMEEFLRPGFDVSYNMETGELVEFKGRNEKLWNELLEEGGDEVLSSLKSTMNAPALLQSLPTKVGSEVILEEINGHSASLVIRKATETTLYATLVSPQRKASDTDTSSNIQSQLYGQVEIDRESGWLNSLNLVMNIPIDVYGRTTLTQVTLAMRSEDEPIGGFEDMFAHAFYNDEVYWYDIESIPENINTEHTLTESDVLPYERGMFDEYGQSFHLTYPTKIASDQVIGHITMSDVKAYTGDGVLLDIDLISPANNQYLDEGMNIGSIVQPIGWSKSAELKEVGTLAAMVEYYKAALELHTLPWQGGDHQTYQVGDLKVTVDKVADTDSEYQVNFHNTDTQWLGFNLGGVKGQKSFSPVKAGPDWLSPGSHQLFAYSTDPTLINRAMGLRLLEEPESLVFFLHTIDKKPSFSREVVFWEKEGFLALADMPPLGIVPEHEYYSDETEVQQAHTPFDIHGELSVATESGQNAVVVLPLEWSSVCQFNIENAPEVNGKALEWKVQTMTDDNIAGGPVAIPPNSMAYQLMTPDGKRRYFYGLDVTTRLTCDGQISWESVILPTDLQPWLFDLRFMEGFDSLKTVRDFLSRYRIYGDNDQLIQAIDKRGNVLRASDDPISDVLFNDWFIKTSGSISRIEQLTVEGEPLEKQFVIQFPPLPQG
ncbi:hypothetical protein [Vibrio renipiscarius]|uniref:Lipoprotein n=1 Tax=Vibrio renipiscarius TaxID=1461322 RepID=A0A0C2NH19_9VIBR|nr:hypothetical protein [Vibrio renipiscarius]KII75408.1 hypothetical protein OJ16_19200 [Vibrio renipiscarius]KII78861.1 hypothetical protein PL18_11310 [Vibrio renipiscarius]